jgi:amino-acid N-acetyltransferase
MESEMRSGTLLRRTAEDIQNKKADYVVFEIDSTIHACGALHDWGESTGEIAALAADKTYSDMGLGKRIVYFLLNRAKSNGFKKVFVLTIKASDWFESLGFKQIDVSELPEKKRRIYNYNRNSKIYSVELTGTPDSTLKTFDGRGE